MSQRKRVLRMKMIVTLVIWVTFILMCDLWMFSGRELPAPVYWSMYAGLVAASVGIGLA
jgi:hypothetical protein